METDRIKRKAVIVGGSNGVGLALTNKLLANDYYVFILDIVEPSAEELVDVQNITYIFFDLFNIDLSIIYRLNETNQDIDTLFISAGIGRVASFSDLSQIEIEKVMTINALSTIQIIKAFYKKIESDKDFYTGIMVSIAGIISSPLFSVYAASKAAISRLLESINVELEFDSKTTNRVLNISPGNLKGTKFDGGENNLDLIDNFVDNVIDNLYKKSRVFIPHHESLYKNIIARYQEDSHKFGEESYYYKVNSGRVTNDIVKPIVGYLSGTFDLFHIGHLNLLKKAKQHCDYLIVGVHYDASHKGKQTFIPFEERKEIINSCQYVDEVIRSLPEDADVWTSHHYDKLFVGSDYKGTERFIKYEKYFENKGVEILYFPYTEGTSSTELRKAISI